MGEDRSYPEIREAVARLCADFPGEYWRDKDRDKTYPAEFVQALTDAVGFMPDTPIEAGVEKFVRWYRDYYQV